MATDSGSGTSARRVVSPALVGRAAELAVLVSAVSAPPAVVSLEGEAGVGKSRLVAELLADPATSRRRALVGRCHPIRESFPLGPVIEAVRGLGGELAGLELGAVAGSLRALLPELAEWLPAALEPLGERVAERHRVFRGLVDVLSAAGPAVLVLEDLHWADEHTTDFVAYLLSDPPAGLVVLVTYRGEQASPGVRALTARVSGAVTREQLVLAPLDAAGTGALAAAILGVDRVSAEFAGFLWERTGGLPVAVEEVLALVRAKGQLVPGPAGGWSRRELTELAVPVGIRDSTLERVAGLPAGARRLAEAAAVLQQPVPVAILLDLTDETDPGPALEDAVGSGLLVEQAGLVAFRHLLAAQAVYEDLSWTRGRLLHDRAATALRAARPVPLGQVAHHLKLAGRVADWTDAAEHAARQAVELGHDDEAVRLLDDVLRNAPLDPQRRGRIAVTLGRTALETVRVQDVADLLSRVLDQDLPREAPGELRYYLAVLLNRAGGGLGRQRRLLTDAIAALDHRPDLRARAMVSLGIATTTAVPLAEDVDWLRRAVHLATETDDPPLTVFVLGKASASLVEVGDPLWRGLADRVVEITGGEPRLRIEVNAYYSIGMAASCAGQLSIADRLLAKALAAPVVLETRRLEIVARSGLAMLDYGRGRWPGLAAEVDALLDELADPVTRVDVAAVAGCLALARGDLDAARDRLRAAMGYFEYVGGYGLVPLAAGAAARLALARGDVAAAHGQVRTVLATLAAKGAWAPICRLLAVAVDVLVAAGELAEARTLVHRAERELADLDAPLAPAAVAHASGLLAAADGDRAAAARQLVVAADRYRRLSCPYEAALAGEAAARCQIEAGEAGGAATVLVALAGYQALGAAWDADRVLRLARRHGVGPAPRHGGGRRPYGTALSPREREVAELAAAGRTNKEIGTELCLSPHTVDKHMRAVVRKLGVRSRAAIGRRLAMVGQASQVVETGKDGGVSP